MPYRFMHSGSTVGFYTQSALSALTASSYYSSSNTLIGTGYFTGSEVTFYTMSMTVSGSSSYAGAWTGSLIAMTESGTNSHGIPVGSASTFTASWAYSGISGSAGNFTASVRAGDIFAHTLSSSVVFSSSDGGDFTIGTLAAYGAAADKTFYYASSSGKLGIGTSSPTNDIDLKADTIKFRNAAGTEELEFKEGSITAKKYAGGETGDEAPAETSGSEIALSYSPGTFDSPSTASVGDVLGTIVWEDISLKADSDLATEDAIAMRIRGVVQGVAADAIKATMNFGIGSSTAGQPVTDYMVLHQGTLALTSSCNLFVHGNATIGDGATDADRSILFSNSGTSKDWVIGVDESQTKFAIHQAGAFVGNNDFEIDAAGNVVIQGDMYCDEIRATGGYPNFTGSTITVDGGTF